MTKRRCAPILFLFSSLWLMPAMSRAEPVCVTSSKATLRQGPGPQFATTWIVPQYMPLMRLERNGVWSQVEDLDGAKHWVHSSSISPNISCLVIKSKTARLREGPGTEHPSAELVHVDRYTPFKKLNREDAWLEVQDDFKGHYWVNETNVWQPMNRARISF